MGEKILGYLILFMIVTRILWAMITTVIDIFLDRYEEWCLKREHKGDVKHGANRQPKNRVTKDH